MVSLGFWALARSVSSSLVASSPPHSTANVFLCPSINCYNEAFITTELKCRHASYRQTLRGEQKSSKAGEGGDMLILTWGWTKARKEMNALSNTELVVWFWLRVQGVPSSNPKVLRTVRFFFVFCFKSDSHEGKIWKTGIPPCKMAIKCIYGFSMQSNLSMLWKLLSHSCEIFHNFLRKALSGVFHRKETELGVEST